MAVDDVLDVMAALGDERRHKLSNSSQSNFINDSFAQAEEKRRALLHRQANDDPANAVIATLSRWNMPSVFGGDSMVDGLPNLFNGQGHRQALQSQNLQQQDEQYKADRHGARDNHGEGSGRGGRLGGGTSRTRQSAAGPTTDSAYTHAPRHAGQSQPQGLPRGVQENVTTIGTWKSQPQLQSATHDRPRTAPTETASAFTSNTERTPHRRPATAADVPSNPSITGPRASATSVPTSIVNAPVPRSCSSARSSVTAAPFGHSISRTSSASNGDATVVRIRRSRIGVRSADLTVEQIMDFLRSSAAAPPAPQDALASTNHLENVKNIKLGEHYAMNPGPVSDKYHATFPDRLPFLEFALGKIAEDAETDAQQTEEAAKKAAAKEKAAVNKKETPPAPIKKQSSIELPTAKTTQAPLKQPAALQEIENAGQESASSAHSSPRAVATTASESTGLSSPAARAPSVPVHSTYGKLVVTFLNAESKHLDTLSIDVNAPVQVSIQMTSLATMYDPRALVEAARNFGDALRLRQPSIRLKRTGAGLWEEIGGEAE